MFPRQSDGERAVHEETMTSESAITVWSPGVCRCWYTRPVTVWSKHILAAAGQRVNIGDLQVVWDSTLGIFCVNEKTHNAQRRDHKQYARRVGGQTSFYPILFNSILNSIIIKVQKHTKKYYFKTIGEVFVRRKIWLRTFLLKSYSHNNPCENGSQITSISNLHKVLSTFS